MRLQSATLAIALVLAAGCAFAEGTKRTGVIFSMKYEGGTLPFGQQKIRAKVAEDELLLIHGDRRLAIPLDHITALSCGVDVRRRTGAGVLEKIPHMHLDKSEAYYVGLTWGGNEAVLKLSASEYRDFVAALERLTGMKAVDTGRVPTVVRYAF